MSEEKLKAFELQETEIKRLTDHIKALEGDNQKLMLQIEAMSDVSRLNVASMLLAGKVPEIGTADDPYAFVVFCEDTAEFVVQRFEDRLKKKAHETYRRAKEAEEKRTLEDSTHSGPEN